MQAEYEFFLLDAETRRPPFGGTDITTTLTNQRLPVLPELVRAPAGARPASPHPQPGVGPDAVRADVLARARPRRRRRQLHLQDVRQGDRGASTASLAELHDEALHRRQRVEQPPAHEPLRRRAATSSGTPSTGELTPEFGWAIGGLLEHAAAAERVPRPDGQLRQALPQGDVRAGERHLGLREPLRRRPREGRARRRHAHRGPPRLGRVEPVPGPRRHAGRDARRHRAPHRAAAAGAARTPTGSTTWCCCRARSRSRWTPSRPTRPCARRLRPRVRAGVRGPQAPRDRQGPHREPRLRLRTAGTTRSPTGSAAQFLYFA